MNEKAKAAETIKPLWRVFYNYVYSDLTGETLKRTSCMVRADGQQGAKLAAETAIRAQIGEGEYRIVSIKPY